jgi:microcystin-dependent protein
MEGTMAEIRMFAGNFNPRDWAFCQGQLQSIAQNTALFALLGTTYGGDGQTTFALPDFRGRIAIGTGQGPGLPSVQLGEIAGVPSVTLLTGNLPPHIHGLSGTVNIQVNNDTAGLTDDASNKRFAATGAIFTAVTSDLVSMAPAQSTLAVANNGSNQPIINKPPYLGMNYIICLFGIFPSRN